MNKPSETTPLIRLGRSLSSQKLRIPESGRPKLFHSSSTTSVTSTSSFTYDLFRVTKHKYHTKSKARVLQYYLPILAWLPNYDLKLNLWGDLIAGFSLASFQIPLVISFSRLAHTDLKCGLLGIIVAPVVYLIFGSCSYLITGPEAAISLILGNLMESLLHGKPVSSVTSLDILLVTTFTSGLVLFFAGLFRLGFLGNVVSQGLLNGFIAALGILMIVTELLTELGLSQFFDQLHEEDPSTIDKLRFIIENRDLAHTLTLRISAVAVIVLLGIRYTKKSLIKRDRTRFNWLNFFPEILVVVVVSIVLSKHYSWDKQGVTVIGKYFDPATVDAIHLPVTFSRFKLMKRCLGTAFICSVLGFFESSTATKALENQHNIDFLMNRELVALGAVNIVGSFFQILPSFGGYGRLKINSLTSKSQLSGIILSGLSLVFYIFFLEAFYYLPECILALIITTVAVSLIEESPENLAFYWHIGGYDEIGVFTMIVLSTLFWSPEVGLSLGVGLSVVKVIRFSTRTKIQILGRVPKTNIFRNADELIEESFEGGDEEAAEPVNQLEEIENCLIVKITEPMIFANSNELKMRLKRLEKYGSLNTHPSQAPRIKDSLKYVIVDCKNMTELDSSATLTLYEIVSKYCDNDYVVMFTRMPFDLKLRRKILDSGISESVKKALRKEGIEDREGSITGSSYGLGAGFYTSIEEALRVANECEQRREEVRNEVQGDQESEELYMNI